MDNPEYQRLIESGVPVTFDGQAVKLDEFFSTIEAVVTQLKKLETVKRRLFSENGYRALNSDIFYNNCSSLPAQLKSYDEGAKLINSVLGVSCEIRPLLENLIESFRNRHFDNSGPLKERASNILQHTTGISNFIGCSLEDLQNWNIEKLHKIHTEKMEKAFSVVNNEIPLPMGFDSE